jgi:hypothetical protein
MQTVTSNFLAAIQSSTKPVFYADLWKDNNLIATLPLEAGGNSVTFDADSDVQGSVRLVVADVDGALTPTSIGSPLTPFGSIVNVRAGFRIGNAEEVVSLGWYVIWDMEVEEAWKSYTTTTGETVLSRAGSRITLTGRDFMQKVADYKFLVPTAPTQSTAWAEIVFLVSDVVGTETPSWVGYSDITIPSTLTYSEDRMEAVKSLAAVLGAEPVMTPAGKLTLRQLNPAQSASNTAPTFGWNINVTQYKKTLSRDGVYNIVVARGKNTQQVNVVAYAIQADGPTSFYSSFGPRPVFYDTDLLNTVASIQAWADAQLATIAQRNTQTVPISALPNPALELGDYCNLTVEGTPAPVTCRVVGFTYKDKGEMDVTLSMPRNWIA